MLTTAFGCHDVTQFVVNALSALLRENSNWRETSILNLIDKVRVINPYLVKQHSDFIPRQILSQPGDVRQRKILLQTLLDFWSKYRRSSSIEELAYHGKSTLNRLVVENAFKLLDREHQGPSIMNEISEATW